MKKATLIVFIFSLIVGCKKELSNYPDLVGEWECYGVTQGSGVAYASSGFGHTLVFQNDGTYKIVNKQDGGKEESGRVSKISSQVIVLKNLLQSDRYLKGEYGYVIETSLYTGKMMLYLGQVVENGKSKGGYVHFYGINYGFPTYVKK